MIATPRAPDPQNIHCHEPYCARAAAAGSPSAPPTPSEELIRLIAGASRRAGRISSETNRRLCERLRKIEIDDFDLYLETVKEHRFLLVLRGEGLQPHVGDTDPLAIGRAPLAPKARRPEAERTASALRQFLAGARDILSTEEPANMILLRGISSQPSWPTLPDVYGLRAAAVAAYPMYRGVAALVGMDVLPTGDGFGDELATVSGRWAEYDFFFLHFKPTDSAGEDGDFDRKAELIESVDLALPRLLELKPDVLVVTGDHSTPSTLKSHSWHPVPVLLWSSTCRPDTVTRFGERSCTAGGLGPRLAATSILPLACAHGGRLAKFGA